MHNFARQALPEYIIRHAAIYFDAIIYILNSPNTSRVIELVRHIFGPPRQDARRISSFFRRNYLKYSYSCRLRQIRSRHSLRAILREHAPPLIADIFISFWFVKSIVYMFHMMPSPFISLMIFYYYEYFRCAGGCLASSCQVNNYLFSLLWPRNLMPQDIIIRADMRRWWCNILSGSSMRRHDIDARSRR